MSLCLCLKHLSKNVMHSEYRPSEFNAADLFIFSLKASKLLYDDDISFNISLHSFRHSCGRSVYKYKYDKYSAADKLLDECSMAFYR